MQAQTTFVDYLKSYLALVSNAHVSVIVGNSMQCDKLLTDPCLTFSAGLGLSEQWQSSFIFFCMFCFYAIILVLLFFFKISNSGLFPFSPNLAGGRVAEAQADFKPLLLLKQRSRWSSQIWSLFLKFIRKHIAWCVNCWVTWLDVSMATVHCWPPRQKKCAKCPMIVAVLMSQ